MIFTKKSDENKTCIIVRKHKTDAERDFRIMIEDLEIKFKHQS